MNTDRISASEKLDGLSPSKAKLLELLLRKDAPQTPAPAAYPRRERNNATFRAPASGAQQRLWFIDQLEGGSKAYHIPLVLRLHGSLDRAALHAALDALVERHEALRTVFVKAEGAVLQQVAPSGVFALNGADLRSASMQEREQEIARHSREELITPFDLSAGPLVRGRLLQTADDEYVLLITMHHTVSDGWSLEVLVRELAALYSAHHSGEPARLQPLPVQYAEYAQWQQDTLDSAELKQQVAFWKEHLQGAPDLLDLPVDRPRPSAQSHRGASIDVLLDSDLTSSLRTLARRLNLTLAMVLHAAWAILLARLSGQDDVVVGIPVANRRPELEGLIGLFVNTLAVRVQLSGDPSITHLLQRVKDVLLAAYAHQDVPFEDVVEALHPTRNLSHNPIFQTMFSLLTASTARLELPGLVVEQQEMPLHAAQFDLNLTLQETGKEIRGKLAFATDLFDAATARRWVDHFVAVVRAMVEMPGCTVSDLPLMTEDQRTVVVEHFNATQVPYDDRRLIHELFEEQVERTPHAVALVCESSALTYAQLNERANQLAWSLCERGVGPDRLVGLSVERSVEMVVGLLGILKAGGAYVPIDPSYPTDRVAYMLADAAPGILLTQQHLLAKLPRTAATVIALDQGWSDIGRQPTRNLGSEICGLQPDHLAYVIYTSGSTGQPKGAMNEHRAVVNRLQWMQQQYQLGGADRVLQKTPFSFDVSVWEFFLTLMTGATLIVARPEGHKDPQYLRELIEQHEITTLHFVPSMLQSFLQEHPPGRCSSIRHIVCSGEELMPALQDKCLVALPQVQLSNLYGPTEAAVDVTFWDCRAGASPIRVPIGRPIANTQIYILDRHLKPVPIGVAGELHIGGIQVGRGYLNRADLTNERFIADPFSSAPGARLYKTGDLSRWRSDGAIEYLGRNDFQVKIRGFRIELGEIEACLASHEQVAETAVLAREDVPGDKRLVAYVVPDAAAAAPSSESLRSHLQTTLPVHMVPSAFVIMERMPLSPNGKLDRRALPAPERGAYVHRHYEPPKGEVEEILAGIWQSLLLVEQVGRDDNFFELGGHSLLLVQMLEQLRRFGLSADVRCVYESTTLADLAGALVPAAISSPHVPPNLIAPESATITPEMLPLVRLQSEDIARIVCAVPGGVCNVQDIYPLAPLQEGILFHHLLGSRGADTYVVPTLLRVASRAQLDQLVQALQHVIDRHDALRTAVLWENLPCPVQVVWRHAPLPVRELVFDSGCDPLQQALDWLRPDAQKFDLRQAPLMRLQVAADVRSEEWFALLQIHHIAGDNTSREILVSEVIAQLAGRAQELVPTVPYRDHVAQALGYASSHNAENFFNAKLGDIDEPTMLFGLSEVRGDSGAVLESRIELEASLAERVRNQVRRGCISAATLFHAAWAIVAAHTSGRDDVVFGTVLLGRMHGDAGAQRIFGMFINTLPLRLQLRGLTATELVERTQQELIELLIHEQASLAIAQRCSGVAASAPLFNALLNYRHATSGADATWSNVPGVEVLACHQRTNYPVVLSVDDTGAGFSITAQTDRRVAPARVAEYLRTAVTSLVEALEQRSETAALSLPILPEAERRQVVDLFNATRTPYPHDDLVHTLFEAQVRRTPGAIAVSDVQHSLTYAELNSRANRLARHMKVQGLRTGEYVAVHMSRSLQMLIAHLAVLKCGGVYVPIDPGLPVERRAFMLRDCGAAQVLSAGPAPRDEQVHEFRWIDCAAADVSQQPDQDLDVHLSSSMPAYVMYTSGSTGTPKGVVVPHHAVNNLALNPTVADLGTDDCLAHHSNPAFDASTFEIWSALLRGARVLVVPQDVVLDGPRFADLLSRNRVTAMYMSVGLFNQYTDALAHVFARLRHLIVGGEALELGAIRKVLLASPPQRLSNGYGPTEATTFTTMYPIAEVPLDATALPIGRPIANACVYILDARCQPVPIGVIGEMYIGGAGVASGYLNRTELTAQRFVPDTFSGRADRRLYRTGDLARWRADGVIEFLGRNDQQVKIRGFRIEPGEVGAELARHEGVREAVVLAREDTPGQKCLVAYVTMRECAQPTGVDDLRAWLRTRLPEYMVPSAFVVLDKMPLTSTGKVNRRGLAAPELTAYGAVGDEGPQGDTEVELVRICSELLHLERLGRHDSFFDCGGHSLLAMQAVVKINAALGTSLGVADIYGNPTPAELARCVHDGSSRAQLIELAREAILDADIVPKTAPPRRPPRAVLLTGATGFVGRFLLTELLESTAARVYCLVRGTSPHTALQRLRSTLIKWGLWREEFVSRVVAVPGDLRAARLGIDPQSHRSLCDRVDAIYHCGTSMNHLETYAMARAANVDSAQELLRLAVTGRPKLVNYLSTLGVFGLGADEQSRVVDEMTSIDAEQHSTARGYVGSKWVAEKIFALAARRGVPCNIFRLGLVWADSREGRYDELQYLYRLLKTCLMTGSGIRNFTYDMAPTPVDYVTKAIVCLANRHADGGGIFHIAATKQMSGWFERSNAIADTALTLLPYFDWIREVKRLNDQGCDLPVAPLLEFAFAMDREAIERQQQRARALQFACSRTHGELESLGLIAPALDDEMLRACLHEMMRRDPQLQPARAKRQEGRIS